MCIESFLKEFDKLKSNQKIEQILEITKSFESSEIQLITSKVVSDRLVLVIINMLDGINPLIHIATLALIPNCMMETRKYMSKNLFKSLLISMFRRLGDSKNNIRDAANAALTKVSFLLNDKDMFKFLVNETKNTKNATLKEHSLKFFESFILTKPDIDTQKEYSNIFFDLLKAVASSSNHKVRATAENIHANFLKLRESHNFSSDNMISEVFSSNRQKPTLTKDDSYHRLIVSPFNQRQLSMYDLTKIVPKTPTQAQNILCQNYVEKDVYHKPKKALSCNSLSSKITLGVTKQDLMELWDKNIQTKMPRLSSAIIELNEIRSGLGSASTEWTKRVVLMKRLRGIVSKFSNSEPDQLTIEINRFVEAFYSTVKNLRSKIHIEIFATLSYIAYCLGDRFGHLFEKILPEVLTIFSSSSLPSVSSAASGIELIFKFCQNPKTLNCLNENLKNSKSVPIRRKCSSFILEIFEHWDDRKLLKSINVLELSISVGLCDADSEVRSNLAECFWRYVIRLEKNSKLLFDSYDNRLQNILYDKCPSPQLIQLLQDGYNSKFDGQIADIDKISTTKVMKEIKSVKSLPKPAIFNVIIDKDIKTNNNFNGLIKSESNNINLIETPANSSHKLLYGPPGFTPFTSRQFNNVNLSYDDNIDKIEEMISEVKFDTILNDMKSSKCDEIDSGLNGLIDIFKKKSKISLLNIEKLQDCFIELLKSDAYLMLIDKILSVLNLFVSSYSFHIENWINTLMPHLIIASVHSSINDDLLNKIYNIFDSLESIIDDELLLFSIMKYISQLSLNSDINLIINSLQFFSHILNSTDNFYDNEYYIINLSNMIHWYFDEKFLSHRTKFHHILSRVRELNVKLFNDAQKLLTIQQQNKLNQIIQNITNDSDQQTNGNNNPTTIHVAEEYITTRKNRCGIIRDTETQLYKLLIGHPFNADETSIIENILADNHDKLSDMIINEVCVSLLFDKMKNNIDMRMTYDSQHKNEYIKIFRYFLTRKSDLFIKNITRIIFILSALTLKDDKLSSEIIDFFDFIILIIPIKKFMKILFNEILAKGEVYIYQSVLSILQYILYEKNYIHDEYTTEFLSFLPQLLQIFQNDCLNIITKEYCLNCIGYFYKKIGHEKFITYTSYMPVDKKKYLLNHLENH